MRDAWVEAASKLKWGNPKEEDTFVGPLISEKEAKRIEEWVQEAVDRGARPRACGLGRMVHSVPRHEEARTD